ncbi:hypothetical protein DS2_01155 [Catenovulum agarivorans DS-2]|uniref:PilZ domain-containing protein n=1 Tax=Catenovulum agarivorans DS-2 TaxID=1328313 RepID=W7QK46_9ALTE|nr:PilZ domain-containing protein [Catenovulum agarivorans]EWH12286.1 hypothetical protein DS2_01155 [Catenovulum agarivorans DS-2]
MTKVDPTLAEYASLIEKLKPSVKSPDFDQVLNSVTSDIPKPKRFLIKMELKRLATPCARRIDLRGIVDEECTEYDHQGVIHYLDDTNIERFEKGIDKFGWYCNGVYEEIINRSRQQKQSRNSGIQTEDVRADSTADSGGTVANYPAVGLQFGARQLREEERMNYTMQIEIEASVTDLFKAVTTDISVSGCRLKLQQKYPIVPGQLIYVRFLSLEKEFALGLKDKIQYKVISVEKKQGYIYPRCVRTYDVDTHSFDEFLANFINGNKRRYKLNLDNTVDAVLIKGYEQYYLPRVVSLPVYIAKHENGALYPVMMLSNDHNKHVSRHWLDENNQNCLSQLLTHKRISELANKTSVTKETTIYGFTHIAKGRTYFYSATCDELAQDKNLQRIFLAFGSSKKNWMVYKAQLNELNIDGAYLPTTLPPTKEHKAIKDKNRPSPRVLSHIAKLKYVVTLTQLADDDAKALYQQNNNFELSEVNQLKVYGHSKTDPVLPIEDVAFKYVNLRSQTRYIYKTTVIVSTEYVDKIAISKDFSINGMQIECPESMNVEKYEKLKIELPDLQQISSKFKLKGLAYEVMGFNKAKTIIHLRVFEERGQNHVAKQFFEQLIDKNKEKLKPAFMGNVIPGLAEALRNLYVRAQNNIGFFIHKRGIRHELKNIGYSNAQTASLKLFTSDNESGFNLYPLLRNNYLNSFIVNMLRRLQRDSLPAYQDLFIRVRTQETNVTSRFETILAAEMRSNSARKIFIQKASQNNVLFFALRVYLSRTGRPDTDYISHELAYVSQYAIHKAKQLEEDLWSVTAVGDIIDITEETMLRYGFDQSKVEGQLAARSALV